MESLSARSTAAATQRRLDNLDELRNSGVSQQGRNSNPSQMVDLEEEEKKDQN